MNDLIALIDQQCQGCGRELSPSDINEFECCTDATADDVLYCRTHVSSYLTLCLECCGVYTANLGGICRYCLEFVSNGER
ncbi:MAG: hypothetical protein AABZ61_03040 [Bacteroidota bacterium]